MKEKKKPKNGKVKKGTPWYNPLVQLVFYDLLLILTPFLMLQNYLQLTVYRVNDVKIPFFGLEIPILFAIFIVAILTILVLCRKYITLYRVVAFGIIVLMMYIGMNSTDVYISKKYTDLQNNWHYFAYGIFTFVMYRFLRLYNTAPEKLIPATYLKGILLSAFDEGAQIFLSSRVFDLSDIAKDSWGVCLGLVAFFFIFQQGEIVRGGWKIRHVRIKDYLKSPFSMLVFTVIFAYILLFISSLQSDAEYFFINILMSAAVFVLVFLIIHFSVKKIVKYSLIALASILILGEATLIYTNKNKDIVYNSKFLTIYKFYPIIYFDALILPDGTPKLTDKKKTFIKEDFVYLMRYNPDIIILSSGADGKGGKGVPIIHNEAAYFIINDQKMQCVQCVVLKTPDACVEYNRLKKMNKRVLLVLHNS